MMSKDKSKFECQQCSYKQTRYFGKCPECGEWNTAVEVAEEKSTSGKKGKSGSAGKTAKPVSLTSISGKSTKRVNTKISELDRVLGGGLVPGQVTLLAGEPGIGKSTILLQVSQKLAKDGVFYVSGEESLNQIKVRAQRLGIKNKNISILEETNVDKIIDSVRSLDKKPSLLIVDSIQTMATDDLSGMAGSVGQVKESTYRLVRLAKQLNIPLFIVGHVTKAGNIAGPAVLMHIVDTVLWFEGDKSLTVRFLRAVKNRFGATDEVGVFSMEEKGLVSLDNPEKIFLSKDKDKVSGSAVSSILQGTRPVLVEIQSLVVPSNLAYPRRVAQGVDSKRFELLLAVLTRRCGLPLYEYDCFLNIAGGISVNKDPSADLAICLAVASAYYDKALPKNSVAVGEVGLLGDVREVVAQKKRIKEAKRLGYKNVISSGKVKRLQGAIGKYIK